jgi:hypothetical protein
VSYLVPVDARNAKNGYTAEIKEYHVSRNNSRDRYYECTRIHREIITNYGTVSDFAFDEIPETMHTDSSMKK